MSRAAEGVASRPGHAVDAHSHGAARWERGYSNPGVRRAARRCSVNSGRWMLPSMM